MYWIYFESGLILSRVCVGQVEFLNSVIVELQRKNEDLKSKLEKMAEAALNGNTASEMDNHERCGGDCIFFLPSIIQSDTPEYLHLNILMLLSQ